MYSQVTYLRFQNLLGNMKNVPKMLSHIKSGFIARREKVNFIYSKKAGCILEKLLEKNYINFYKIAFVGNKHKVWSVGLKYDQRGESFLKSIKFFSKPGRRFILSSQSIEKLPKESDYLFIGPDGAFWLEDIKKMKKGAELLVKIN